jgi:hypothetical protein
MGNAFRRTVALITFKGGKDQAVAVLMLIGLV